MKSLPLQDLKKAGSCMEVRLNSPRSKFKIQLIELRSSLGQGHIFLDFHCLQVLDPEKANFVSKHES